MAARRAPGGTLDAIVAWLIELAERAPVLMAWEDLHWADPNDIGNIGHADRAGADGGSAGRRDLSTGTDAALAATLHLTPITLNRLERPGSRRWSVVWSAAGRCPARWSIISSPRPTACRSMSRS